MVVLKRNFKQQSGAALAVGLILLLIMTILAISMSQTTRTQERIAGIARDLDVAHQALDSALRAGELAVLEAGSNIVPCTSGCLVKPFNHYHDSGIDLANQNASWWSANGIAFGAPATQELAEAYRDPYYVVQVRGSVKIGGSLDVNAPQRTFYSVTAYANGVSGDTELVGTTVYSRAD